MSTSGLLSEVVDSVGSRTQFQAPRGQSLQLWGSLAAALPALLSAGAGVADGLVRVLDCGGGSGSLAVPLAVLGCDVTVVDVSIDALGTLRRRAGEAGVSDQVHAIQGEAETLSDLVEPASHGLVIAHELLASVNDRAATLGQLSDAVAPGGLLSVVIGNPVSAVLSRAVAGDAAGALALFRRTRGGGYGSGELVSDCDAVGLAVESVMGLGVFTELVSGSDTGGLDASDVLAELEAETCASAPYRDLAAKIHLLARRPSLADR